MLKMGGFYVHINFIFMNGTFLCFALVINLQTSFVCPLWGFLLILIGTLIGSRFILHFANLVVSERLSLSEKLLGKLSKEIKIESVQEKHSDAVELASINTE